MPKNVKRGPLGFFNIHSVTEYQKIEGVGWETFKNFWKKFSQCQKNCKGDPLVSFAFVCYVKKGKHERGALCTKFPLAGLGRSSSFSSFCKKRTFQCEVCGLENKPGTAQVGAISKAQKQQKDFQVFSSTVPEKPKSWTELAHQRRHFEIFHPFCRKSSKKLKEGHFWWKKNLKSHNAEKTERGDPLGFFNIRSVGKLQKKLKGGPFGKNFFFEKKSHRAENTLKSLWSLWVS